MNITFLILIVLIVITVYLLKNLLKIKTGRFYGLSWILTVSIILMLSESILALSHKIQYLPHFLLLSFPIRFLIAPILILISLKVVQRRDIPPFLRKGYAVPALLSFMVLLPVYALDASDKRIFIDQPHEISHLLIWVLFVFHVFLSVRFSGEIRTLLRQKNLGIWSLLSGLMGFQLLQLLGAIEMSFISIVDMISVSWVGISLIFFMFFHFRDSATPSIKGLLKEINEAVVHQKLYLKPDLTLRTLSDHLERTPNEVSKAINTGLSLSFNDFINQHRVKEVIRLLQDKDNHRFTLEGISKMAGFNSSTSFNKNFKKVTGKTPKAYRLMTES